MSLDVAIRLRAEGAEQVKREVSDVGDQFEGLRSTWAKLAGISIAGLGLRELGQMADEATTLSNRLKLVTGSAAEAAAVQRQLFEVAQSSRVSYTELGATYASIARAGAEMGVSQSRLLTVTQAIGNAMTISGGSAAGMQAALVQLSQGLASGTLRGEELNSVMEQAPRLARALADGLGVSIGQLRTLGAEGKITAEAVMAALEQSAPQLAKEVAGATLTLGQAFTVLGNSTTNFVGQADQASGASGLLARAIQGVAGGIDALGKLISEHQTAFAVIGGTLAGAATLAGLAGLAALVPLLGTVAAGVAAVAVAAGPVTLAVLGLGAAVGALTAAWSQWTGSEAGMRTKLEALQEMDGSIRTNAAERKADIQRLTGELAVLEAKQLDVRAEDARFARATADYKAREKAVGELTAVMAKLYGVDEKRIDQLRVLRDGYERGDLSLQQYRQAVDKLTGAQAAAEKAAKEAEQARKQREEEQLKRAKDQNDFEKRALEDTLKARRAEGDAALLRIRRYEEQQAAADKSVQTAEEMVQAIRRETEQLTMSNTEREIAVQLLALEKAGLQQGTYAYEEYARRIKSAIVDRNAVRTSIDQAKSVGEEWQRLTDDIGRGLTDSLFRAFESGKGFFRTLWDGIRNTFKSTVLKLAVNAAMRPVNAALGGMFGASGPAAASGGGGDALGTMGNLASLAGTVGSLGTIFGTGAGLTLGGNLMGALSSAGAMMSGGATMSGLAMGAGALGPIALGLMALYSLRHKATPHTGSVVSADAAGVSTRWGDDSQITNSFSGETDRALRGLAGSSIGALNALAKTFGSASEFSAVAKFAADGKDASIGQFILSSGGRVVGTVGTATSATGGGQYAFYSKDREDAFKAYGTDVARTVRDAMTAVDLPQWARDVFAGLSEDVDLDKLLEATNSVRQTQDALIALGQDLAPLGGVFGQLGSLSSDARMELAGMVGGIDELRNKARQYVKDYYTEGEQAAITASQIRKALRDAGLDVDLASRQDLRTLLDGTTLSDAAGRQQAAALLNVAADFAQLSDYLQAQGLSLNQLADQAPQIALIDQTQAQTELATRTADGIDAVNSAIVVLTDAVTTGLAATVSAINATTSQLRDWDAGGAMVVTNGA